MSKSKTVQREWHQIAHLTFFSGLIVSILTGLFPSSINDSVVVNVLLLLGVAVGLFNLTAKHMERLLLAIIALLLSGFIPYSYFDFFGLFPNLGSSIFAVIRNLVIYTAPVGLIVSLKVIWKMGTEDI